MTDPPASPPGDQAAEPEFPVFVRRGDALAEVDAAVALLGGAIPAGLHKLIYVERAVQTGVMVTRRDAPLADALRARGWIEPREED